MRIRFRLSAAVLAMSFAAGCAGPKPRTPEQEFAAWLSESPRAIGVSVAPAIPDATLVSRDSRVAARVGSGVLGGVVGFGAPIYYGCMAGPIGCVIGALLAPVGAVLGTVGGASNVESSYQNRPLDAAQGAPELLAINQASDLPAMLATAVSERRVRSHTLRPVPHASESPPLGAAEGKLLLSLEAVQLLGDVGEDPEVALILKVASEVQTFGYAAKWSRYSYEGSSRRVSVWLADDARLLREEIKVAARTLAADVAEDLASPHAAARRIAMAEEKANREARIRANREARARANEARARMSRTDEEIRGPEATLRALGKIEEGDVFPAGELFADTSQTYTEPDNDMGIWFVVKLSSPGPKGEKSYAARLNINCSAGAFSVEHSIISATENGSLPAITWDVHSPKLVVDKPSAPLAEAIRAVCKV